MGKDRKTEWATQQLRPSTNMHCPTWPGVPHPPDLRLWCWFAISKGTPNPLDFPSRRWCVFCKSYVLRHAALSGHPVLVLVCRTHSDPIKYVFRHATPFGPQVLVLVRRMHSPTSHTIEYVLRHAAPSGPPVLVLACL